VRQALPVDGFRLDYQRAGRGPAVLLLHGWPGDRTDYRDVLPLVSAAADVVVPDLRGFGGSDKHQADPASQYTAAAQARSIAGLIGGTSLAERAPVSQSRIAVPTTVLWPAHDPLFPMDWSDRLDDFFTDARLTYLDAAGHFTPREAPREFAAAVVAAATRTEVR
jgi:pimeloyl-ACP methyl ester carboxylesterase